DGIRYFHVTGVQTCALPISALLQVGRAQHVLAQELHDLRPARQGLVHHRVVAALVGADGDQVAVGVVGGDQALERADALAPGLVGDVLDHAADRGFDVDGRVQAGVGDPARQQDVAVEDGAGGVGDRVLRVVAFGQHGVEGGDRAAPGGTVAG